VNAASRRVQRCYLILLLLHTLAASFIWGINTLFLLDAGLSNAEAFGANAVFTVGLVLFEVPTGVLADIRGRRFSYLVGTLTLAVSTVLYLALWYVRGPFWAWALVSALLGGGFTFFSGAVQAWLVDALKATGFDGPLDAVFAKGEIIEGVAMLTGAAAGGYLAQMTNLGAPYALRALVLVVTFVLAGRVMHDLGFHPKRMGHPIGEIRSVLSAAIGYGLKNAAIRPVMVATLFTDGVAIYAFYAAQPYLLELYHDPKAYGMAGLAAAVVGGAQIGGGLIVPRLSRVFARRTTVLLVALAVSTVSLGAIGLGPGFWTTVALLATWGLAFSTMMPVRQAYVNGLIPSEQRATVLSFDSLMGSAGGAISQPILGRTADVWGYPASYAVSAAIQALGIPWLWLTRRQNASSDAMTRT
jgi:MFS family permease